MYRILAVIVIVLGVITIGFSSLTYAHMREIAMSPGPGNEYVDVRIMTAGMLPNSGTIDAAEFCRQLATRVYLVFGAGIALLHIGGAILVLPRDYRRKQSIEHGVVEGPH